MKKPSKPFSVIDPNYMVTFAIRFLGVSLLGFAFFGIILHLTLNRRLGVNYFQDISTLSQLQEKLPIILIVTGVIQTIVFSVLLLLISLFWAHKVSGPMVRFRKWLEMVKNGNKIENIQFRAEDQLHGLAVSFRDMQASRKRRNMRLSEDLKAAASIIEECERCFKEGNAGSAEFDIQVKSLREIYQAAKNRLFEKNAL